jgi:hypothetical protein
MKITLERHPATREYFIAEMEQMAINLTAYAC